jgi:integrase
MTGLCAVCSRPLAEQLGHSSVSVTERNYKHFLTDARHGLAVGLDDALVL